MGFIGLAKFFLNSTIGTDKAVPLDKLIGVKSVQRGMTSGAMTINVSPVNMAKSYVISVSKGSEGYVAARGTISANFSMPSNIGSSSGYSSQGFTGTLSGGATSLTTKQYSATLTTTSTLVCDGAVEWQLIENY